jgi:mono/diheme cytochrome c family protein
MDLARPLGLLRIPRRSQWLVPGFVRAAQFPRQPCYAIDAIRLLKKDGGEKDKNMKKACFAVTLMTALCFSVSVVHGQDTAAGEKTFKTKCAGCHGADAAGKPAVKSPSIKGKSAEDIEKVISTSKKHASLKKLTPDEVKSIAAYLATLK